MLETGGRINLIKLVLTHGREVLQFIIENKVIKYTDRKWNSWIQVIPMEEHFKKRALMSRNKIPKLILALVIDANQGKNYEEWKEAKTDSEVAEIIIKDAKTKGAKLQKRMGG